MSNLTGNQIGGYKATISNPNTSEEAKEHAREVLEQVNDTPAEGAPPQDTNNSTSSVNNRVLGGYKATLHNPNTSEDAKQRAKDILDSTGADNDQVSKTSSATSTNDEHTTRVLAGYKATLTNPNTGEEAKAHAQEVLNQED